MNKLQREVETYWVCVYFQQQMRANPRAAWHAMLLCWFKQDVGECAAGAAAGSAQQVQHMLFAEGRGGCRNEWELGCSLIARHVTPHHHPPLYWGG